MMFAGTHSNHNTMKSDLTSSALRIYLTYLLQQTDEVLESCRFQLTIATGTEKPWQLAINAADELKDSIANCQRNLSYNVAFLCVVDSLQDALRESLQRAENYDRSDCVPFDANVIRARYLTYGFTASDSNEPELSSLWLCAAQNLQLRLELKFATSVTESRWQQAMQHVHASESVKMNTLCLKSPVLNNKAVLHYHYAAALSALGRPHSHDYAAELYKKSSDARNSVTWMQDPNSYYSSSKDPSAPGKLVHLERAAAAWQLAAEMVATKASNNSILRDDPAIQSVVLSAKRSAKHADEVPSLLKIVEECKAAVVKTKEAVSACRDTVMLLLWHDLSAKQEEAVAAAESCFQSFIDGTIDADAAKKSISTTSNTSKVIASHMHQLQLCNSKAAYYKLMAAQALQGTRPSPLANKCWTQAAVYIADVANMCMEELTAACGTHELRVGTKETQRFRTGLADDCVYIVVNVLGSAVEYLDKARGAEAGEKNGRDPREAQMWRKAATCLMQKAKIVLKEMAIREKTYIPSRFTRSSRETTAVKQMDVNAQHYAKTAEYLHLSYKHLTASTVGPQGTRVSFLYVHTAELMMRKVSGADPASVTKLVNQHLSLIHVWNESETVSQDIITARELICECGEQGLNATEPALQQLWQKANSQLISAVEEDLSRERLLSAIMSARLYASAARTVNLSVRLCFASAARACEVASRVGDDAADDDWSDDDSMAEDPVNLYPIRLALYYHVLAGAILALGGVHSALPAEATAFLTKVQQDSAEEGELKSHADEHAQYILLRDRCELQCAAVPESGSALEAWKAVQRNVNALLTLLDQRAENAYQYHQIGHIANIISFRSLVVKCCVAFSEAPPDSDRAVAWKKAVDVCEKTDPCQKRYATQVWINDECKNATEAVERAMDLAQAQLAGEAQMDA